MPVNNPLDCILREIRRRTGVVGAFPDGQAALNLRPHALTDPRFPLAVSRLLQVGHPYLPTDGRHISVYDGNVTTAIKFCWVILEPLGPESLQSQTRPRLKKRLSISHAPSLGCCCFSTTDVDNGHIVSVDTAPVWRLIEMQRRR
jgi:hypothetical protein